jgi:hypothetical protein
VEIALILWAISISVVQRYKIWERNANPLTLVNTNIISHFSSFFGCEMVPRLIGIFDIEDCPLLLCERRYVGPILGFVDSRKGAKGRKDVGKNIIADFDC